MQEVDKKTCWYRPEIVIEEMNRFHDKHIRNHDIQKHLLPFTELLALTDHPGEDVIDLGCGTAMLSMFCKNHRYIGADLPHILQGCAMRNYPEYFYRSCDLVEDDLSWIKDFNIVIVNGVIDIMQYPLEMLGKILDHCKKYLVIHRQEITEKGETHTVVNGSYGGTTYHSIFSRKDFMQLLDEKNFEVVAQRNLEFGNWENGGCSFLLRKRKSYALHEMDYKLNKIFGGKRDGFFIEAGANDGITQSNTYFLEFYKNWIGILIEPVGILMAACLENRSQRNHFFTSALVDKETGSTERIIYTPGCNGLLSVMLDENSSHMMKRTKEKGELLPVAQITLNSILEAYEPEHIDLLSLDVEGYELKALKGIDFDKWKIDYLLIEELEENGEVQDYLSPWYELVDKLSEHDYLYKRRESGNRNQESGK